MKGGTTESSENQQETYSGKLSKMDFLLQTLTDGLVTG